MITRLNIYGYIVYTVIAFLISNERLRSSSKIERQRLECAVYSSEIHPFASRVTKMSRRRETKIMVVCLRTSLLGNLRGKIANVGCAKFGATFPCQDSKECGCKGYIFGRNILDWEFLYSSNSFKIGMKI